MALTTYGDISPRTAVYAIVQMLKRALPNLVLERFGQTYVVPNNKSKVASFRRYEALALATTPLTEGVTPVGSSLTFTDYTATLVQYGDFLSCHLAGLRGVDPVPVDRIEQLKKTLLRTDS